jgi:hypothetical protein
MKKSWGFSRSDLTKDSDAGLNPCFKSGSGICFLSITKMLALFMVLFS